jgi:DNA-binding transcriptional LysR family regulator
LLLDEPVYLVTSAGEAGRGREQAAGGGLGLAGYADRRWIAGCDRCRDHLLSQCAQAGFVPKISFTTDDYVAVQALVAAGLGVTTLPGLALRAARHPGVRAEAIAGVQRRVFACVYGELPDPPATAVLLEALVSAAPEAG